MGRIVRHPDDKTRSLFHFPTFNSYSSNADRLVFLSERDFHIITSALFPIQQMHTRVYSNRLPNSHYEMVGDTEFETFQGWVADIYTNLGGYIVANELLERIAIALETYVEGEDARSVTFNDVLEVLNLEPTDEQADLIEAFQYLSGLLPGMPQMRVNVDGIGQMIGQWRFNGAVLNMMEDIALSQRAQAVAQGGADMAAIYDDLGETVDKLLLPAGFAGRAIWLWNRIKPKDVPNWVGWLSYINGLLLGSIRDATYSIVGAIEDKVIPDYTEAISGLEFNCAPDVNVSLSCGGSGGGGSAGGGGNPFDPGNSPTTVTDIPPVNSPDPESPPPDDFPDWEDYMCRAASWWFDRYIGTLRNIGTLSGFVGFLTIAVVAGLLALTVPPVGIMVILAALATLIGIDIGLLVQLDHLAEDLEAEKAEAVCELIGAADTQVAKDLMVARVQAILATYGLSTIPWAALEEIAINIMYNTSLRVLFEDTGDVPNDYPADCSSCGEECEVFIGSYNICDNVPAEANTPMAAVQGSCGISGTTTWRLWLSLNNDGSGFLTGPTNVEVTVTSGTIEGGGFTLAGTPVPTYGYYNQAGDLLIQSEDQQLDLCAGHILILSQSPFSAMLHPPV